MGTERHFKLGRKIKGSLPVFAPGRGRFDVSGSLEADVIADSTGKKTHLVMEQLVDEMSDSNIEAALTKMSKLNRHLRARLGARLGAVYARAQAKSHEYATRMLVAFDAGMEALDDALIHNRRLRTGLHCAIAVLAPPAASPVSMGKRPVRSDLKKNLSCQDRFFGLPSDFTCTDAFPAKSHNSLDGPPYRVDRWRQFNGPEHPK